MIVYKSFKVRRWKHSGNKYLPDKEIVINCEGWYLFGIIPLYIRKYY